MRARPSRSPSGASLVRAAAPVGRSSIVRVGGAAGGRAATITSGSALSRPLAPSFRLELLSRPASSPRRAPSPRTGRSPRIAISLSGRAASLVGRAPEFSALTPDGMTGSLPRTGSDANATRAASVSAAHARTEICPKSRTGRAVTARSRAGFVRSICAISSRRKGVRESRALPPPGRG